MHGQMHNCASYCVPFLGRTGKHDRMSRCFLAVLISFMEKIKGHVLLFGENFPMEIFSVLLS